MAISSKMRRCGESVHYLKKLKSQMESTVNGDYQYKLEHEVGKRKLIVHTDRVDDEKLETVSAIIDNEALKNIKVVQYNQSIDIPWRDWTPGFIQVEYLENASKSFLGMVCLFETAGAFELNFLEGDVQAVFSGFFMFYSSGVKGSFYDMGDQLWPAQNIDGDGITGIRPRFDNFPEGRPPKNDYHKMITFSANEPHVFLYKNRELYLDGIHKGTLDLDRHHGEFTRNKMYLFSSGQNSYHTKGRIYSAKLLSSSGTVSLNLVPALDPTGAPCMYDTVSRQPFYNKGSDDFLYPGKEEEPTVFSLRQPATYGQLTENGLRRLYHVPVNYKGTKEEYATKFGFKPIVEIECPEEGKYIPQWKETENEIILEWIEIENPEEISNE